MSAAAAQGASLNQQALRAATAGSYSTYANPFSAGATIGSTGGARTTWEDANARRPKRPNGQKLLWVRPASKPPKMKLGGRLGVPGRFSRRVVAVAPPAESRPPVMERLFAGGDNGPEPQFGNFHRSLSPEQGGLSHIRIELQ